MWAWRTAHIHERSKDREKTETFVLHVIIKCISDVCCMFHSVLRTPCRDASSQSHLLLMHVML